MRLLYRILGGQPQLDRVHDDSGARRIDAGTKAQNGSAVDMQAAQLQSSVRRREHFERLPNRWREELARTTEVRIRERMRHDADDRRRHAIDRDGFPERRRISTELLDEIIVREYDNRRGAGPFVVRQECAAEQWASAHQLKESGRDVGRGFALDAARRW